MRLLAVREHVLRLCEYLVGEVVVLIYEEVNVPAYLSRLTAEILQLVNTAVPLVHLLLDTSWQIVGIQVAEIAVGDVAV